MADEKKQDQVKQVKQDKKAAFSARKSAIEIVRLRNNYYRDSYRFLMGAVLALVVLCV
jgi:hypothetical protein